MIPVPSSSPSPSLRLMITIGPIGPRLNELKERAFILHSYCVVVLPHHFPLPSSIMTSTAASRPAPPPVPSHSTFLRAQIRSSLAHLRATSDLDNDTFQQIDTLLTNGAVSTTIEKDSSNTSKTKSESEEERQLGANNAWLRKMLVETSLLSDTIGLAMTVAVPSGLLGSAQRQSIIELVEVSKVKIANAITDPNVQNKTTKGARGAHAGLRKGFSAASQSVGETESKERRSEE